MPPTAMILSKAPMMAYHNDYSIPLRPTVPDGLRSLDDQDKQQLAQLTSPRASGYGNSYFGYVCTVIRRPPHSAPS